MQTSAGYLHQGGVKNMHVVSQNLQNSPRVKRKKEQHLGDESQYLHSLTMNTIPKIKSGIFGYVGVQTVLDTTLTFALLITI